MSDTVDIFRLNIAGSWVKTVGTRRDKAVVDAKRGQAHAIDRSNVFISNFNDPIRVASVEELEALEPPFPRWDDHRHAIAVEDNSVLPLFPLDNPPPIEMVERTVDLLMAVEENKAPLDAERADSSTDHTLLIGRLIAGGLLAVVCGGLVIAGIVAISRGSITL